MPLDKTPPDKIPRTSAGARFLLVAGHQQWEGWHMASAGARAYNGGLGAEPRAEPLVRGSGGRSPPEAERF